MFEIMDPCWDEFMEWLEEQGETLEEQVSDVFQTVCDLISGRSTPLRLYTEYSETDFFRT
jgi:hypothetical protein